MPEFKLNASEVTISIGPGKEITIGSGKIAKLANGACTVRQAIHLFS